MRLWRIATETRTYRSTDLSGAGAAKSPGRWNQEGFAVVYCAPTIALAVLETAAHLDDSGLPMNRYLIAINVPEEVWEAREASEPKDLEPTWDAIPAGVASVEYGTDWITAGTSALMLVPSVIVPEEQVVLLNPAHPDAAKVTAKAVRKFEYNRIFRR